MSRPFIIGGLSVMAIGAMVSMAGLSTSTQAQAEAQSAYTYKFVSSSDLFNMDIGDVTGQPYYQEGQPNSTNHYYQQSVSTILDAMSSEGTNHLFVAGDLVEGHWGMDSDNTGTFGPVDTEENQRKALRRAANLYYDEWNGSMRQHGLTTFTAIGDHEIGDNPWVKNGKNPYSDFKYRNLGLFKEMYSKKMLRKTDGTYRFANRPSGPAAKTAYAVRLHPEVLLVSIDVFKKDGSGVIAELDSQQLWWLDDVLKKANKDKVDWIIVQGHTPILGPVRQQSSSGLMYKNGATSTLWKMLARHKVDLYFSGEVHDVTMRRKNGVTQISHGGYFSGGGTNYLVGTVTDSHIELVSKHFTAEREMGEQKVWQTDTRKSRPEKVVYHAEPFSKGETVISKDGLVVSRTGLLAPYKPE